MLSEAQLNLQAQPNNEGLRTRMLCLKKEAIFLADAERHFYGQLAKCSYLKWSNRNTKFFHAMLKRKAKRNYIAFVIKRDGSSSFSKQQVPEEFVTFYQDLLGTDSQCVPINLVLLNFGLMVSYEKSCILSSDVSKEEIKYALFSIGEGKSPSLYRFTSCFFKKA